MSHLEHALAYYITHIVNVRGKRITGIGRILKLWHALIASMDWRLKRMGTVLGIVPTRYAEVDEVVLRGALGTSILLDRFRQVVAFAGFTYGVPSFWVHGSVHHDVQWGDISVGRCLQMMRKHEMICTGVPNDAYA